MVKGTISYSKIWLKLDLIEIEATYLRPEFIDLTCTSHKSSLRQIFDYEIVPLTRLKFSEVKVRSMNMTLKFNEWMNA